MISPRYALVADHVFDGSVVHRDAAVVIEGHLIAAVLPRTELPISVPSRVLRSDIWLAPGFIDVQVNGGGDVLFNDAPTAEGIRAIARAHRKFGTTALLPTLISDTAEKAENALEAVADVVATEPSILGIHLEGPFLSPERRGTHDVRYLRKPTADDSAVLIKHAPGIVVVVTLAPERVPKGFIRLLSGAGLRVCLGHSAATYLETRAAIEEGLAGFTHLFNAMPQLLSREPGPVAAALESPHVWFGMIVDGVHVDPAMLGVALRGRAKPMLVTDAMPPVGGTQASFPLYGETITVVGNRCARQDGTLAGTALNMASAVRNCVQMLGVSLEMALSFASLHPAGFLKRDHQLGRLRQGFRADIVAIEPVNMEVIETWVAGAEMTEE